MPTMTDKQLARKLWDTGHFWDVSFPNLLNVKQEDLDKLTSKDQVMEDAVLSYQEFFPDRMDFHSAKINKRQAILDGEVGPVTEAVMGERFCPLPDFAPPPNAVFDYGDPDLNEAVRRMQESRAIGRGSWPMPCQKEGVKYHIDESAMPSAIRDRWPTILSSCVNAYAKVGLKMIRVDSAGQANIRVWWTRLAGSTIGIAQFNSQSCGDSVTCRLDTGYTGYVAGLLLHEWGHNMNLEHTRGGVMNPSITPDPTPFEWHTNDPSYPTLVRLFGGEPIPTDEPPPGPGPVPSTGITFRPPPGPWEIVDVNGKVLGKKNVVITDFPVF